MSDRLQRYWAPIVVFLLVAILCGGVVLLFKRSGESQPLEISLPAPTPSPQREVYIGGAVANPGFYLLEGDNAIEDLIQAVGGITADAHPNKVEF